MKKYDILKILLCLTIIITILTYIIPISSFANGEYIIKETNPIGLNELGRTIINLFTYFATYILLILGIGGLYGILSKTGAYGNFIDTLVKRWENKENKFLLILIIFLLLFSAFIGLPIAFLVLVPLFITILVKMGFHKITIFASTFGSILVGNICSIYSNEINFPITKYLYLDNNEHLIFKIIFFIIIAFFFSAYVINRAKKDDNKKDTYISTSIKRKKLPIIVIGIFFLSIMIIGGINWNEYYHIDFFNKIGIKLSNMSLILGNIHNFGMFDLLDYIIIIFIMSIIISFVYSLSFDSFIDSYKDGMKRFLVPSFYVAFAGIIYILLLSNNNTIFLTISHYLLTVFKNAEIILLPVISFLGGIFYIDYDSFINTMSIILENTITNINTYSSISFIMTTIYGLSKLILPTSIMLVTGLSLLDISLKEWFKYIFKFIIIVLIISTIFNLIII